MPRRAKLGISVATAARRGPASSPQVASRANRRLRRWPKRRRPTVAELVKAEQKMTSLRDFWEKNKGKVVAVLPKHFSPDRQGQLLFTVVYTNPALLVCPPPSIPVP